MGISVVVIVKDDAAQLRQFRRHYNIPYLLLSDPASQVIRQFGILNDSYEPATKYYGSPHPGVFLVNADAAVIAKFAEQDYRNRPLFDDLLMAAQKLSRQ